MLAHPWLLPPRPFTRTTDGVNKTGRFLVLGQRLLLSHTRSASTACTNPQSLAAHCTSQVSLTASLTPVCPQSQKIVQTILDCCTIHPISIVRTYTSHIFLDALDALQRIPAA